MGRLMYCCNKLCFTLYFMPGGRGSRGHATFGEEKGDGRYSDLYVSLYSEFTIHYTLHVQSGTKFSRGSTSCSCC
jgi:hypothetical protein